MTPGPPLRQRPFLTGFTLAVGVLSATTLWNYLGQLATILWCVAVAGFLAIGLNPFVRRLERLGLSHGAAVTTVSVSGIAAVGGVLFLLLPALFGQATLLMERMDHLAAPGGLDPMVGYLQRFVPTSVDVDAVLVGVLESLRSAAMWKSMGGGLLDAGLALSNMAVAVSVVLVLTAYFLAEGRRYSMALVVLLPCERRETARRVMSRVGDSIGRYFSGQLALALLHGALTLVVLLVTGSAMPLFFAAIALIAALVPLVGLVLSATVIVGAQALIEPTQSATWITLAIWHVVYIQVEAYVIAPRILGRAVSMPNVVVLLATLAGGTLFGICGALLAVPAVVAAHAAWDAFTPAKE